MGQAPATDDISLRTVPRNFPGRSGTPEDKVHLVSPETATASALTGVITDPRTLDMAYPRVEEPERPILNTEMLVPPLPPGEAAEVELRKGPNIRPLPELDPFPNTLEVPVLLKVSDDISTDEILPAGARVLPFRSNIPKISEFTFDIVDPSYSDRATATRQDGGHAIVGGANYGQGSSREHAALAPRFLGLRLVLAKGFARIHRQNLILYGVLPLCFEDEADWDHIEVDDVVRVADAREQVRSGPSVELCNLTRDRTLRAVHDLSDRQVEVLLAGGLINWARRRDQGRSQG
jgi:aconitate hydratase